MVMRCPKCGRELDMEGKCSYCSSEETNVRVMTHEEKAEYDGVTIEEPLSKEDIAQNWRRKQSENPHKGIFIRNINFGSSSWISKITFLLIVAAIIAFVIFIALPIVLIAAGIGVIVWIVLNFLRG